MAILILWSLQFSGPSVFPSPTIFPIILTSSSSSLILHFHTCLMLGRRRQWMSDGRVCSKSIRHDRKRKFCTHSMKYESSKQISVVIYCKSRYPVTIKIALFFFFFFPHMNYTIVYNVILKNELVSSLVVLLFVRKFILSRIDLLRSYSDQWKTFSLVIVLGICLIRLSSSFLILSTFLCEELLILVKKLKE